MRKEACELSTLGRQKFANSTILSEDGVNYLTWKTLTEFNLRLEVGAWQATIGELTPSLTSPSETVRFEKANAIAKSA